jgi:hypothetical protein
LVTAVSAIDIQCAPSRWSKDYTALQQKSPQETTTVS